MREKRREKYVNDRDRKTKKGKYKGTVTENIGKERGERKKKEKYGKRGSKTRMRERWKRYGRSTKKKGRRI